MQSLSASFERDHSMQRQADHAKVVRSKHRLYILSLADKVNVAVFEGKPQEEINLLLKDLREATTGEVEES